MLLITVTPTLPTEGESLTFDASHILSMQRHKEQEEAGYLATGVYASITRFKPYRPARTYVQAISGVHIFKFWCIEAPHTIEHLRLQAQLESK
jgi:hypothetical protein